MVIHSPVQSTFSSVNQSHMSTSRSGFSLTTNAAGVVSRLLALILVVGVGLISIDRASAGVITSSGDRGLQPTHSRNLKVG